MTRYLASCAITLAIFTAVLSVGSASQSSSDSGHTPHAFDGLSVRAGDEGAKPMTREASGEAARPDPLPARTTSPHVLVVARGVPVTASTDGDVETAIVQAAFEFGQDPKRMLAVAWCESKWNPDAIGDSGMAIGLWQFHSQTFADYARRSGLGYSLRDIGDPVAQSRVAGWAWRDGRAAAWTCAR